MLWLSSTGHKAYMQCMSGWLVIDYRNAGSDLSAMLVLPCNFEQQGFIRLHWCCRRALSMYAKAKGWFSMTQGSSNSCKWQYASKHCSSFRLFQRQLDTHLMHRRAGWCCTLRVHAGSSSSTSGVIRSAPAQTKSPFSLAGMCCTCSLSCFAKYLLAPFSMPGPHWCTMPGMSSGSFYTISTALLLRSCRAFLMAARLCISMMRPLSSSCTSSSVRVSDNPA